MEHHARNGIAVVMKKGYFVLYSKNSSECKIWHDALNVASRHKLENFYQVKRVIGVGGFATVRLGIDKASQKLVAVKSITKSGTTEDFLHREISILKAVNHPNVVDTFDIFDTADKYHIVMEYMGGGMLFSQINDREKFSEQETRLVIRQILKGVSYLHSMGIVHRDLKPENVLHVSAGSLQVKLADFGLSNFYEESSEHLMKTMIGTPQFVAPEMIQNEEYGCEVDLWAVGIMMFNLLTGTLPFSEKEVLEKYRSGHFKIGFDRRLWKGISKEGMSLTKQLLCRDVSRRVSAPASLQHDWFSDYDDMEEINTEFNPRLCFRKTVLSISFLLRLYSKSGLFFDDFPNLGQPRREDSQLSNYTISSGISLTNTDWDFDVDDFYGGTVASSEKLDRTDSTSPGSFKEFQNAKQKKLLKDLSTKRNGSIENYMPRLSRGTTKHQGVLHRSVSIDIFKTFDSPRSPRYGQNSVRTISERKDRPAIAPSLKGTFAGSPVPPVRITDEYQDFSKKLFNEESLTPPAVVAELSPHTKNNFKKHFGNQKRGRGTTTPKATRFEKAKNWFSQTFSSKAPPNFS